MTVAPEYHRLHDAVDRLTPRQVAALFVVVESMLGGEQSPQTQLSPEPPAHRLSFTGAGDGPTDLAERARDYLRASAMHGHQS